MLPKPVTALALSAIVSLVSFAATPAVAAPSASSDVTASSQVKGSHHGKKDGKKPVSFKKKGHLASLHSAEPKSSPKEPGKEPKLAASLSTHLDLKKASDKPSHVSSRKPAIAATGKEITIGGPTKRGASVDKSEKSEKLDKPVVQGSVSKSSGKLAYGGFHGRKGPMSKAGRAPSRPATDASKMENVEPSSDDHPVVPVALRPAVKVAPKEPCLHEPIEFVRGAETDRFPMTQCDGATAPLALERLSVIVRPESAERPAVVAELASVKGPQLAPGVRRVDPGLIERLQLISDHFAKPGMPERISIVSGYRPGSTGSYHASAQALDIHFEGVPNEALVDFCKTLENTGCGYYPNSSFVHFDVRPAGTGHVAWIDTSGPGEPPHYVASWPPAPEPDVKTAEVEVNPYAQPVPALPPLPSVRVVEERVRAASINAPLRLKDWE